MDVCLFARDPKPPILWAAFGDRLFSLLPFAELTMLLILPFGFKKESISLLKYVLFFRG